MNIFHCLVLRRPNFWFEPQREDTHSGLQHPGQLPADLARDEGKKIGGISSAWSHPPIHSLDEHNALVFSQFTRSGRLQNTRTAVRVIPAQLGSNPSTKRIQGDANIQ